MGIFLICSHEFVGPTEKKKFLLTCSEKIWSVDWKTIFFILKCKTRVFVAHILSEVGYRGLILGHIFCACQVPINLMEMCILFSFHINIWKENRNQRLPKPKMYEIQDGHHWD